MNDGRVNKFHTGHDPLDAVIQQWLVGQRLELTDAIAASESPIETMFAVAMLCACDVDGAFLRLCAPKPKARVTPIARGRAGALYLQHAVLVEGRQFRADFTILGSKRIVIELDGHAFHERTREQATADKSRDRLLTADGWMPLRFTGSEVYRDAHGCAAEVLRMLGLSPGKPVPAAIAAAVVPVSNVATQAPGSREDMLARLAAAERAGDQPLIDAILRETVARARVRAGLDSEGHPMVSVPVKRAG